jgi:RND superfamily putative drug exporter
MTLVPAVLSLLGDRAWWFPKWLDRITPRVDIEGENLRVDKGPETKELADVH